jgi:hypothetical protein
MHADNIAEIKSSAVHTRMASPQRSSPKSWAEPHTSSTELRALEGPVGPARVRDL